MCAASWLGYSDEKMKGLLEQSKIDGFHHYKLKVGGDLERDLRRLKLFRDVNGWDDILMLDSNQVRLSPLTQTSCLHPPLFDPSSYAHWSHRYRSGLSPKQRLTSPILPPSNLSSSKSPHHLTISWVTPLFVPPSVNTISKSPPANTVRIASCSSNSCKQRRWTTSRWMPVVLVG